MTFRSALVTTNGWPIGRQPCDTTSSGEPTADVKGNGLLRRTRWSQAAGDSRPAGTLRSPWPPMTGTFGRSSFIRSSRKSAGTKRLAKTIKNESAGHSSANSSAQPSRRAPSAVRLNLGASTSGERRASEPANGDRGCSSISQLIPAIASRCSQSDCPSQHRQASQAHYRRGGIQRKTKDDARSGR